MLRVPSTSGRPVALRSRLAPSALTTASGGQMPARAKCRSAGDEDLAEGAVGEGRERLRRAFQWDGGLDVDPQLTVGDPLEQCTDLLGGRGSHDRGDNDVLTADLLGRRAERGGDGAAGLRRGGSPAGAPGAGAALVAPGGG